MKLVCPPDHDDLRQDITICMGFLGYDVKSQSRSMCDRLPGCGLNWGFCIVDFMGEYWIGHWMNIGGAV